MNDGHAFGLVKQISQVIRFDILEIQKTVLVERPVQLATQFAPLRDLKYILNRVVLSHHEGAIDAS